MEASATATASTSAFDPAAEFPNIVWNFDNMAEPTANTGTVAASDSDPNADEENNGEGLLTAPPTPPAHNVVTKVVSASQSIAKQASPIKEVSSANGKSTSAKRKGPAGEEGSSRKRAKKIKPKSKKPAEGKKEEPEAVVVEEKKPEARMAKNLARKEAKREKRRLKRKETDLKQKGQEVAQVKQDD